MYHVELNAIAGEISLATTRITHPTLEMLF
jgi:hypothetical protein